MLTHCISFCRVLQRKKKGKEWTEGGKEGGRKKRKKSREPNQKLNRNCFAFPLTILRTSHISEALISLTIPRSNSTSLQYVLSRFSCGQLFATPRTAACQAAVRGDCSLPGSSVHGIVQARTLEWAAMSSSRGSSPSRDQTHILVFLALTGGFFTTRATIVSNLTLYWIKASSFPHGLRKLLIVKLRTARELHLIRLFTS